MRLAVLPGIMAFGMSATAEVIDVPLEYRANHPSDRQMLAVSRVRVADFDMLTPGARPAPLDIDFDTSRAKGLSLAYENYMVTDTVAGRNCRRQYAAFALNAEDKYVLKGNRPDIHVLVDYFDEGATNPQYLRLNYDAMTSGTPDPVPYRRVVGPDIGSAGMWRQHQFHVRDAYFGNRQRSRVPGASQGDFLVMAWERDSFRPYGYASLPPNFQPPPGNWKLPPAIGTQPVYTLIKIGEKSRLARFDRQASADPGYNRMLFDENGNGDLTDDPVLKPSETMTFSGYWGVNFPLKTVVSAAGAQQPIQWQAAMRVPLTTQSLPIDRFDLHVMQQGSRGGTLTLGGKQYRVAVVDRNCDGVCDTGTSTSPDGVLLGDRLYIAEGNRFGPDGFSTGDNSEYVLGDHLMIGEKLYRMSINPLGTRLRLEWVPPPSGVLKLSTDARNLQVYMNDGEHSIAMVDPPNRVHVPPGTYVLNAYTLEKKDADGDLWSLRATNQYKSCAAKVEEGRVAELVFGEPYLPAIETRPSEDSPANKKAMVVETKLVGRGKEVVREIAHVEGTRTRLPRSETRSYNPKEPTYRIAKLDGEIAASGSFEYG